ncbi:hypothetical protein [Vibrio parahaemolyticus]|uniref:hypothetical protein n=1 Tax=Vibrio parahaemolyticus TaxID=670 RepID=UPI000692021F|nr:hypothetical protein [Vibrio parahaemolyticus]MDF4745733.1 hypothetical protein [Vibrio parahaemolyticus]MDS1791577.1 hypothetical protein [Vibrio parahaemolyticus]OTV99026.1 hypothetical protein BA739_21455 [Vibrio parahaemolyticus]OTW03041.1 hypothetical protein BA740_21635 [Vibrio parahaemolyticus]
MKLMKITKTTLTFSLLSSIVLPAHASDIELLTESEKAQLSLVEKKHAYHEKIKLLNSDLSLHTSRVWEYTNTSEDLRQIETYLQNKILTIELSGDAQSVLDELRETINKKNHLSQSLDEFDNLDTEYRKLKEKFTALENERKKYDADKRTLLTSVVNRIQSDIEKSTVSGTFQGTRDCLKSQSIPSCLSNSKPYIKEQIINDHMFLGSNSTFERYEVKNAVLDMYGKLSYEVTYSAQPLFNKEIYFQLNKLFGFESIPIKLNSNVEAEWYINGKLVGHGKSIDVDLPDGSHGILATYQGKTESSVESIVKPKTLQYNFSQIEKPLSEPTSKPNAIDLTYKKKTITSDNGNKFTLIVNAQGTPVLNDWSDSLSLCKDHQSSLALLNDFVKLVEDKELQFLFKYNLNTLDHQTIAFTHTASVVKDSAKGVTLCKLNQVEPK